MNWKKTDANELCVSIFLNNMGWYLGVMVNIYNDEILIYILEERLQYDTPIIFNETLYHCWYK